LSKTGAKKASSKVASPKKPASVNKAAVPKKAAATKTAAPKAAASKSAKPKAAAAKPAPKAVIPKKVASPKAKTSAAVVRDSATETLKLVLARLDDMKAEETVTIDLRGKSAFSDYMVVTTGRSNRHVGAVAENVAKGLKEAGNKKLHVEGMSNCDWVLIDSGEVILHVFRPEVREFYNLERLWTQSPSDEPRIDLKAV
jgi:ribosome-associated protein